MSPGQFTAAMLLLLALVTLLASCAAQPTLTPQQLRAAQIQAAFTAAFAAAQSKEIPHAQ